MPNTAGEKQCLLYSFDFSNMVESYRPNDISSNTPRLRMSTIIMPRPIHINV